MNMLVNKQSTFPNLLREYSSEFDPAVVAKKVVLKKSETGLGIHLVSGSQGLFVSSLIPGAPAHTSGEIRTGDKLLRVNGQDVSAATEAEVEKLFRAKGENSVEIICQHKPEEFLQLQSRLQDAGDDDSLDQYLQGTEDESYYITDEQQDVQDEKSKKKTTGLKSSKSRDGGRSVATSMSARRSESRGRRKSDAERYVELSAKWDQARHEVRQEDHETLREKVTLQQELIRKQDAVAEQKRLQEAQTEAQKKDEQRNKRQAKQAELLQICKDSLEEDKKTQRQERAKLLKLKKNEPVPTMPSPTNLSPTSPSASRGRRSTSFRMTLPAMSATPDILDPDEEDEDEPVFVPPKNVAWHEQQLYNLYGKKADYFLHPKIEAKVQVKKANPKLRRQGVEELFANYWKNYEDGRAGAEVLWQTLRNDSNTRLRQEDASIPHHLKDAYGAFARQSLKTTNHPVRRMFCVDNDLPELTRLVDHSRVQQIHRMKHKRDLMYRASVTNQDRTEVLKFNNPLPDFNEKAESINQYLPSWQDDISEESIPEYMQWLQQRGMLGRENTITEEGELDELDEIKKSPKVTQSLDEDLMLIMARRHPTQNKQKFVFLTENDTRVKGEFSDKYKDEREYKDIPRPYDGAGSKSFSAMGGMISATPDKSSPSLRYSAPLPRRYEAMQRYTSGWEPLSMTALVEYKKQLDTIGEGDFSLGRTKMWSNIPVV